MARRLLLGLLGVLCVLPAAAACGGGSPAAGGAAGVIPAGVPVYVSIDTDFEGDQIEQARELLARFPGSSGLLGMLEAELSEGAGVDFEQDVRPALGDRLDIAVLELPSDDSATPVVALLEPDDQDAFDALLEKASAEDRPVVAEIDGWTALAEDQATLDRFEQDREAGSLEESDEFKDAMDGLAEEALVRLYVGPSAFREALAEAQPSLTQLQQLFPVNGLGVALPVEDRGIRLEAAARTEFSSENFEPELPSAIPGGAIAYIGFGNVAEPIRDALDRAGEENPEVDQQIAQLELALGLSLQDDVLPLLERETAIAIYPGEAGAELPAFLVAMRVEDEAQAVATVDQILERAGQFFSEVPAPTRLEVEGVELRQVALSDGTTILYGGVDGTLFATTDSALAAELIGDGSRLADDEGFVDAGEQAELPDEIESLVYVNLNEGATYVFDLAEQAGESIPPQVAENVEPLAWLLFYSTREDDRSVASGFLALDE
jgi:Protein of unknown function (DUF3352)